MDEGEGDGAAPGGDKASRYDGRDHSCVDRLATMRGLVSNTEMEGKSAQQLTQSQTEGGRYNAYPLLGMVHQR